MIRKLIRETYGSVKILNDVRILAVVFMLGGVDAPGVPETDITALETERAQFGDLIIGDFVDTYRNLSRKSIMTYDWLVSYCHEADIVVKTDDDVMVNIFKLTEELGLWPQKIPLNIWCAVHFNEMLNRTETSPYYVSPEEYPNDIAPAHCAGVGYVTPMTVVRKIADEISRSYRGAVCQQEDIFMTGIVTERIRFGKKEPIELIDRMVQWVIDHMFTPNLNYQRSIRPEMPSSHYLYRSTPRQSSLQQSDPIYGTGIQHAGTTYFNTGQIPAPYNPNATFVERSTPFSGRHESTMLNSTANFNDSGISCTLPENDTTNMSSWSFNSQSV
ncbi:hypothetical protein HA402_002689 [Bradysia odoriphaga]|nr:hypothetical protein HA402_002689 [Bradysia odoriphaga]